MNQYEALSADLNLPLVGEGSALPKIPLINLTPKHQYVEGYYQGRHLVIHDFYRTLTGQNSTAYHSIKLWLKQDTDLMLAIMPKGLLLKLAAAAGMQDIATGDDAFDKAFVVKSSDEAFVQSALQPQIREQLLANQRQWPWHMGKISLNYDLRDNDRSHVLRFEQQGNLHADKDRERAKNIVNILSELADAVEGHM